METKQYATKQPVDRWLNQRGNFLKMPVDKWKQKYTGSKSVLKQKQF